MYVNGHEWLARLLDRHGIAYRKQDNFFVHVSDTERAQQLADGFATVDWVRVLGRYARQVKHRMKRNWVKRYNKEGVVLRVETVLNDPEEFRIRRRVRRHGRTVRPFNPVARQERTLFEVRMGGEYVLHGFTNRELREHLMRVGFPLAAEAPKQSGQVTRLLRRLHIHRLIAKIPRSRRWRVPRNGCRVMATAVKLREVAYPGLYAEAA